MEPARGVDDPPEGAGNRRGGMGRPASAPARLLGHVGNRRRRPEGQPVHRHHVRDAVPVAGHRLPHTGQYNNGALIAAARSPPDPNSSATR